MVSEDFFSRLGKKPIFINTSRGQVNDSNAVKRALKAGKISGYVADVWENEPAIDPELIVMADIATPHIAGYSVEGKANGTTACVRAASRFFGFGIEDWYPPSLPQPDNPVIRINAPGKTDEEVILEAILAGYDIIQDDRALRKNPASFENLRNHYPVRREFEAFTVKMDEARPGLVAKLRALGFNLG
jgi:erythronate-4-phosphate dehydrogenase